MFNIIKNKIQNYFLENQVYLSFAAKICYYASKLIPNKKIKSRICDIYLRYNPRAAKSHEILLEAIKLSSIYCMQENLVEKQTIVRSIIIKRHVSSREKGVILISFENQLGKLAKLKLLNELEKEYSIIFVPSWQPFYSMELYQFLGRIKEPFFIMPSSQRDMDLCEPLGLLCRPLSFQASSWVDADKYMTSVENKDIDIVMLANFSKYKRHWLLFEALSELEVNVKTVIAGRPLMRRCKQSIVTEAKCYGVEDRIEIIENPSNDQIIDMLSRSKIFCALSYKEGSYIAVVESMMAGTPVVMFDNAIIGSKDFVNEHTGVLVRTGDNLSEVIKDMLSNYNNYDAAAWARGNISAEVNCNKLNMMLKRESEIDKNDWMQDILPFYCENFNFYYKNSSIDLKAEYAYVENKYGLAIRQF